MGSALIFIAFLYLIRPTVQFSLGGDARDVMVSAWSHDILTDGWNGVPRGCGGKPAEVYFVLDTAQDTSPKVIEERKRYLSDLSALFYLDKTVTRVGVVSYGKTTVVTTPLGTHVTLPEVQKAVQETEVVGGSRNTADALALVRLVGFSRPVARQEVAHVVILMTNGFSADSKYIAKEADLLRKQGVYLYVVSDTSSGPMDKQEVHKIASSPNGDFVFTTDDWNIVDSLMNLLHIEDCNYQVLPPLPGKEAACSSRRPTELMMTVEHLGLGSANSQQVMTFIQDLLAEVDPMSDIRVAVLTSKDPVSTRFAVARHVDDVSKVERRLGSVVFPDLGALLKRARRSLVGRRRSAKTTLSKLFVPEKRHAEDVQRVMVTFVDDSVQLTKSALAAIRANRRHKIDTYVVYIGDDTTWKARSDQVKLLANGEDHIIRVSSYGMLQSQATVLDTLKTVCRGL